MKIGQTSLLIALGLFMMMYPVLAKVRYEEMGHVTGDRRLLWLSLLLNWVIGPFLMFVLAWVFLADEPAFRTGLIVIGLARCIAMVLIWNDLACGDSEAAALLVALNSVFQIVAYALLGTFYLEILPGWLGLGTEDVTFSTWEITKAVLIFLGIPLAAGYLTRRIGLRTKGREWYEQTFIPRIGPYALYGLLFTIVIMFASAGRGHHVRPAHRREHRHPAARLLRDHVGGLVLPRDPCPSRIPQDGDAGLHGRRQQLRAGHRGEHRRLGRHLGRSPDRCDRSADRGAGPGRARVRVPLASSTTDPCLLRLDAGVQVERRPELPATEDRRPAGNRRETGKGLDQNLDRDPDLVA